MISKNSKLVAWSLSAEKMWFSDLAHVEIADLKKMDDFHVFHSVAVSNVFTVDDESDKDLFFSRLARLNVNDSAELSDFLGDYKLRKLHVVGFNSEFVIVGRDESAVFDDYILDVWRKYYVGEEVVQIGIIQAKLPFPLEVRFRFIWKTSVAVGGEKTYACQRYTFW